MRKTCSLFCALLVLASTLGAKAHAQTFSEAELAYMPATKQIELFKAGVITPLQVLEAQIARVAAYNGPLKKDTREELQNYLTFNGKVNALCFERFAEARKAAKKAGERYRKGTARPLEGITVGVKNENEVKDWRVDNGSVLTKDNPVCPGNGAIIDKLEDAGAIFVFSTTVPEFYLSSMTWSKLYGVTRNPWNGFYGAGGSSGGSGAALAAGFCTLATGSDMGGSIRIPASMNGVYGFKPPFGRVPTSNISYETLGPLTRTFGDLVLMQNVLNGPSPKVMSSLRPRVEYPAGYEPLRGAKVAVCHFPNWIEGGLDRETKAAMDATVANLKAAGVQVDVIKLEWRARDFLDPFFMGLMSTSMYEIIEAARGKDLSKLCPYSEDVFKQQAQFGPKRLIEADTMQNAMHTEVQKRIFEKGYTALIMPNMATPHVPAELDATPETKAVANGRLIRNSMENCLTPIWNLLCAYPVISVPVGLSSKNVPIGLQVVGNTYDDLAAFRVASAISSVMPQLYSGGMFPDFRNAK